MPRPRKTSGPPKDEDADMTREPEMVRAYRGVKVIDPRGNELLVVKKLGEAT